MKTTDLLEGRENRVCVLAASGNDFLYCVEAEIVEVDSC